MYAKVIVDVPSRQTDHSFDYKVPLEMESTIQAGCRVGVRFGSRLLQGFVIALTDQTEVAPHKLKSIVKLYDLEPSVTSELLQLARWMAHTYVCPQIIALQAMLPRALKSKHKKKIVLRHTDVWKEEDPLKRKLLEYMKKEGSVELQTLLGQFPTQALTIKQWVKIGKLQEQEMLSDRISVKKHLVVVPKLSAQELTSIATQLSQRAFRQKQILTYLAQNHNPVPLKQLLQQCKTTSSTVRTLEQKGWIKVMEEEIYRDPYKSVAFEPSSPLHLTPLQSKALEQIKHSLGKRKQEKYLLHGVTGSGKTEVYLQAIQHCMDLGRQAIVLVPEIALTPQMVERFKGRFGDNVAVLHSRLSDGERYDEWRKIQRSQVQVAIGARSAIFAPFTNLGLIVLDEEHESSYKQEESPKYHAREVAIQRANYHGATVVLGSATPSMETYHAAISQEYHYIEMPSRVGSAVLPKVHVVDMRSELKAGNRTMFSRKLYEAIQLRLKREEQIVLLLNRRGYSTFVMCRACGYTLQCPHCDISLTYHRNSRHLRCHYCGYAEREPTTCPSCDSPHIRFFGTGTQRVEEELYKHFPGIRVIRMDIDTTSEKGSHEKWLNQFKNKDADVLLGTQMVAKGLDFPYVTLVGVIAADTMLHLPDFRAAERTFHLLTQVAGRAGRHQLPGEVVIQTYLPEHYSIVNASQHDFRQFVQTEMNMRKKLGYPPFCRMALITLAHVTVPPLIKAGETLRKIIEKEYDEFKVYGPVASPIPKRKDHYRFQCIVKFPAKDDRAVAVLRKVIQQFHKIAVREKIVISADIDPLMLM